MRALLPLLLLATSSCGGQEVQAHIEAGYSALHIGEPAPARAHFEAALAELEPGDAPFLEAAIGRARALAHIDAGAAVHSFLELAARRSVDPWHYRSVVIELAYAEAFREAVELLEAGREAHPEYPGWQRLIQEVGERVRDASGDWEGQHWLDRRLIAGPRDA